MSLLRPEGPPILDNELVDRETLAVGVSTSSDDPDGLGLALGCFSDSFSHVTSMDVDLAGLGKWRSAPGVTTVENEFYLSVPPLLALP